MDGRRLVAIPMLLVLAVAGSGCVFTEWVSSPLGGDPAGGGAYHYGTFDEPGAVSTKRVSKGWMVGSQADGASYSPELSPDGRFVAFWSAAWP